MAGSDKDFTLRRRLDLICPVCKADISVDVFKIADLRAQPALAEELRTGRAFRTVCPSGHALDVDYSLIILDGDGCPILIQGRTDHGNALEHFLSSIPRDFLQSLGDGKSKLALSLVYCDLLPVLLAEEADVRDVLNPIHDMVQARDMRSIRELIKAEAALRTPAGLEALRRIAEAQTGTEGGRKRAAHARKLADEIQRMIGSSPEDKRLPETIARALEIWKRWSPGGSLSDVDSVIAGLDSVLAEPGFAQVHPLFSGMASSCFRERFHLTRRPEDLDRAIALAQKAVSQTAENDEARQLCLRNLGDGLIERFELSGDLADLEASIASVEQVIEMAPEGHDERPLHLDALAQRLAKHFSLTGARADLDQAIKQAEEAVRLSVDGRDKRPAYLNNLATHLIRRFKITGVRADLDQAMKHAEESVQLATEDAAERPLCVSNLSAIQSERFKLTGEPVDLDQAIARAEEAVELIVEGNENRAMALSNLADRLADRYNLTHERADLEQGIARAEEAVRLSPEGHDARPACLHNLAALLLDRYWLAGEESDLERGIAQSEQAVRLTAESHAMRPSRVGILSSLLAERFLLTRELADLDHAIARAEEVVQLAPEGQDAGLHLGSLANCLSERFKATADRADMDRAIEKSREAVSAWQRLALESEDAGTTADHAAEAARSHVALLLLAGARAGLVQALDAGKAFRLRAELSRSGRVPAQLDAAARQRYEEVRAELREAASALRALAEIHHAARSPTYAGDVARWRQIERKLRDERSRLEAGDAAFAGAPLDYAAVCRRACEANEAIVYLQPLTGDPQRLLALAVHPKSDPNEPVADDILIVDGLGRLAVLELLAAGRDNFRKSESSDKWHFEPGGTIGWLIADHISPVSAVARKLWLDTISRTIKRLGHELMMPLAKRLDELGVSRVVLLPGEGLSFLPFHAAAADATGTPFGELFETRYAPSVASLVAAARPVARIDRLIGISNPDGSLAFSDLQMRRVSEAFGNRATVRHGPAAGRAWLLEEARHGDIVALSTHAAFDVIRPLRSYFILAEPNGGSVTPDSDRQSREILHDGCEKLTLDDILRGAFRLKRGALVVADACETGKIRFSNTVEEAIGFPAAFLTAGAGAVIASLWSVPDFSTALLMEEMYRRLRAEQPPARALQEAARWLRQRSRAEIASRLDAEIARAKATRTLLQRQHNAMSRAERSRHNIYHQAMRDLKSLEMALNDIIAGPDEPFSHPYYWAAFAVHGNSPDTTGFRVGDAVAN